jgi:beta-glucosidase-like glycosyl hydrolase
MWHNPNQALVQKKNPRQWLIILLPGHGFVAADSHLDLPVDERPLSDISQDMQVFKDLINHGLDAVMPAHVVYSQVDSSPAGFSSKWITLNHLFH